ncbi:hypothetical protein IY145_00705 [Methylosinus sp. H3A]|uniref:hypothetical protein n=1 Tax=Methylosinus sp. H3A TaxID=2785786 RepID=UPI0018C206F4|nr:hypothetical protein [Methylosinus sp. H3A]MBG0807951.1 hypothetical protein [Methylosinus sp. H3A]
MRLIVNTAGVAMVAETPEEADLIAQAATRVGHVFELYSKNPGECRFIDRGAREFACREPINVVWTERGLEERWRPISNLAPTAFELDGQAYASIEGFWQGLKFSDPSERTRIARLSGTEAMRAGQAVEVGESITFQGRSLPVGGTEHWSLMRRACWAKFEQNEAARLALLATGDRLLTHKVRRDSRTIPGAIMADMWMSIRVKLRKHRPARAG